jgi:hypothetical protein
LIDGKSSIQPAVRFYKSTRFQKSITAFQKLARLRYLILHLARGFTIFQRLGDGPVKETQFVGIHRQPK